MEMQNILFNTTQTVVIKTNNKCNLRCSYCYDEFNQKVLKPSMSIDTYTHIQNKLITYSKKNNLEHLNIIWHGGEPLLMGIDFYKKVLEQQKRSDFNFSNLIQTNATLFDFEWINFFKRNKFKIGISFDGSAKANIVHRQRTEDVVRNLEALNSNGISPSVICVISDQNYMYYKEIFKFFDNYCIEYLDLVPCYENNGRFSLSEENYIKFFVNAFDIWINKGRRPNIRTFSDILNLLTGNVRDIDMITCSLTGRCGEIISISPKGDIYFCDCLPKEPQNMIGNILNMDLFSLSKASNYTELRKINSYINKECLQCKFKIACGSGCLTRKKENDGRDYYCNARKTFLEYICQSQCINAIPRSINPIPAFTRGPQPNLKS